jgi:ATP-dependent DNA ligase
MAIEGPESAHPPTWIKPQLTRLADEAPAGSDWLHEIKYDGELCALNADGVPVFSRLQAAMNEGRTARRGRWSRLYRCA